MSYRRKAPAASVLKPAEQLGKLCNSFAGNLPFQSHNSVALLAQLYRYNKTEYDQFLKKATVQRFVPAWIGKAAVGCDANAVKYVLPLPKHFINEEDSATDFEPRSFFLKNSDTKETTATVSAAASSGTMCSYPRCGLTGLFFSREEVCDNLQAAAADMGFTSPFWIRSNHPGLVSEYLKVKSGSEVVLLSLTTSVISLNDVEPFTASALHSSLRHYACSGQTTAGLQADEAVPLGMNAMTGVVSQNPFLHRLPNRGLWLSQDQLLYHNLKVGRHLKQVSEALTLIEVDQWELFNADQLQVPGRLALRRSMGSDTSEGLFHSV